MRGEKLPFAARAPPARVEGKSEALQRWFDLSKLGLGRRVVIGSPLGRLPFVPSPSAMRRAALPFRVPEDIIQPKGAKVLRDSPTFYLISVLHKKYIPMCNGCSAFLTSLLAI